MEFLRSWPAKDISGLSETLGVDRTKLYGGIAPNYGPPPPYEAVWGTNQDTNTTILHNLLQFYNKSGLDLTAELKKRPDDITTELEFQRQLILLEEESWRNDTIEIKQELIHQQFAFLTNHLLAWIPRFIDEALPQAQTDFYRGHLIMLRGLLADEEDYLKSVVN